MEDFERAKINLEFLLRNALSELETIERIDQPCPLSDGVATHITVVADQLADVVKHLRGKSCA